MHIFIPKSTLRLLAIAILFISFAGYNFIGAYDEGVWFPPAAGNPPDHNVLSPINHGTSTESMQLADGNLAFDQFTAFSQVNAEKYCDLSGGNCDAPGDDIAAGKNYFATMRAAGYPVPAAPQGMKEWPNEIICEDTDDENNTFAIFLRAHAVWTNPANTTNYEKLRYRDMSGDRLYTFYPDGGNSSRVEVVTNCSSKASGSRVQDICAAGLCVY